MEQQNLVQKFIWFAERLILLLIAIATLYAVGYEIFRIIHVKEVNLSDLFLLFIYAEVLGMVATFYANNRIPVTLPLIIAMTALCRLIILHSKDADPWVLIAEAGAILVLAGAAYMMSLKDKLSIEKEKIRNKQTEEDK